MKAILFNTEMARAVLEGRKTVTWRVVKPQPMEQEENPQKTTSGNWYFDIPDRHFGGISTSVGPYRPPYRPGDILYVRETWAAWSRTMGTPPALYYKADRNNPDGIKWRSSIHMPREAARIFLRVTDVRVERLREIDDAQAYAEGAEGVPCNCDGSEVFCSRCCNTGWLISPRSEFARIWDSTIKPAGRAIYGWAANPWVWVIEFERISKKEAGPWKK